MNVKIEIKGVKGVQKGLEDFMDNLEKEAKQVLAVGAKDTEGFAKRFAPLDFGKLKQQIIAQQADEEGLLWQVEAGAPYSAYLEFGTRGFVDIPEGWEDIAIYWKADPLIKMTNIHPQPFMYPALLKARKVIPKDMENLVEDLVKDFNK